MNEKIQLKVSTENKRNCWMDAVKRPFNNWKLKFAEVDIRSIAPQNRRVEN